jgi:hypothetical protein
MNERELTTFDRPMLARLKRAYHKTVMKEEKTFLFEGHEYAVDYGKELIEYVESVLNVLRQ